MQHSRKQEMRDFIKDHFKAFPGGSIESCAKALDHARLPIIPAEISAIRKNVLDSGDYERPKLAMVQPVEVNKKTSQVAPTAAPKLTEKQSVCLRRAYLNQLAEADPYITPTNAIQAVKAKFGVGTDPVYTIQTIMIAREVKGLPLKKPKPIKVVKARTPTRYVVRPGTFKMPEKPKNVFTESRPRVTTRPVYKTPTAPPAREDVKMEKDDGPRTLTWVNKGERTQNFSILAAEEVKEKIKYLLSNGVDASTIQLWKPVPMKMKVEIDFS